MTRSSPTHARSKEPRPLQRTIGLAAGALGVVAAVAGPALASSRIYGEVATIQSDSTDRGFEGRIKATGFSVGIATGSTSVSNAGVPQPTPLVITKIVDGASTGLMKAAASGSPIPSLKVSLLRVPAGASTDRIYATLVLTNARVSDWRISDTTAAAQAAGAVEQVTFVAQSYTLNYIPDGSAVASSATINAR